MPTSAIGVTVSNISRQLTCQFFNNWPNKVKYRDRYLRHFSKFLVQIFKVNIQYKCIWHTTMSPNFQFWSPKIFWQKMLKFRALKGEFWKILKICINNQVWNELLRLSWKFEVKVLRNAWPEIALYITFLVSCWR